MSVNLIKQHLEQMVELHRTRGLQGTTAEFVLKYGLPFTYTPLPKQMGKPLMNQACFENSINMAYAYDLIYVEGYAAGVFPTHHAWCVDRSGTRLFDFTWETNLCNSYFGVPLKRIFVSKRQNECKPKVAVLDYWEQDWPLERGVYNPSEFLEQLEVKWQPPGPKPSESRSTV